MSNAKVLEKKVRHKYKELAKHFVVHTQHNCWHE